MKDLERIRDEILTIFVLILTLAFTSCNITPESLENKSLAEILLFTEVLD